MAGKTWSQEEEDYYWVHVIPFSRRRKGLDLANPELTFKQLGEKMQAALGENPRRVYTALCLEEHFYLNIESGRTSKNARKHVKKYRALALKYPGVPEKTTRAMQDANDEVEPTHPATKPGAENDWELGGDENAEKRAAILEFAAVPPDNTTPGKGKRKFEVDSNEVASPTQMGKGKGRESEPIEEPPVEGSTDEAVGDISEADVGPITEGVMEAIAGEALGAIAEWVMEPATEATLGWSDEDRTEVAGPVVRTQVPSEALQEAIEYVSKGTAEGEFHFSADEPSDRDNAIDAGDPEVSVAARDLTVLSRKAQDSGL